MDILSDIGLKNSNSSKMMYVDAYYFNKIARKVNDIEEDLKQEGVEEVRWRNARMQVRRAWRSLRNR